MRKIHSKKEQARKERRMQIIIGILLLFVMLFSTLGYAFQRDSSEESSTKEIYNGIEFNQNNGFWVANINSLNLISTNLPEENNISTKINSLSEYYNQPLYISSTNSFARAEVERNLNPNYYNNIVARMQEACFDEECEIDAPLKTCENNFIIIRKSENSNITQEDNCVFIEGKEEDLVMLVDEFLFKLFEIK